MSLGRRRLGSVRFRSLLFELPALIFDILTNRSGEIRSVSSTDKRGSAVRQNSENFFPAMRQIRPHVHRVPTDDQIKTVACKRESLSICMDYGKAVVPKMVSEVLMSMQQHFRVGVDQNSERSAFIEQGM